MKAMYGVVLLCTEGMAICEDDWEDLWCAEMPEEFVTEGDGIEIDGLTPLHSNSLPMQIAPTKLPRGSSPTANSKLRAKKTTTVRIR